MSSLCWRDAIGPFLYGLGLTLCTVGAYALQPYTGKGPPGTYVAPVAYPDPSLDLPKDQERAPSAPLIPRPVQVEAVKPKAPRIIAASCARLAARYGEVLPGTKKEYREAEAKVRGLARKGDALARECLKDMKERRDS